MHSYNPQRNRPTIVVPSHGEHGLRPGTQPTPQPQPPRSPKPTDDPPIKLPPPQLLQPACCTLLSAGRFLSGLTAGAFSVTGIKPGGRGLGEGGVCAKVVPTTLSSSPAAPMAPLLHRRGWRFHPLRIPFLPRREVNAQTFGIAHLPRAGGCAHCSPADYHLIRVGGL